MTIFHSEEAEGDTMELLLEQSRKQTGYSRILAYAAAGILAAVILALLFVVPRTLRTLKDADRAIARVMDTVENADETMESVTRMSGDISAVSTNLNRLLNENAASLTDGMAQAMDKINGIDFEGLNDAITDLRDVVQPMADFINKLKKF